MINRQLFELLDGVNRCADLRGEKFAYALLKNKNHIESEIKRIYAIVSEIKEFDEYETSRIELAKKHSKVNKKKEPIIKDGKYVLKSKRAFDVAMKKLKAKYAKAIEKRQKQIDACNKEFDQEMTLTFHKVKSKDMPKDITARQLEIISKFMYDQK